MSRTDHPAPISPSPSGCLSYAWPLIHAIPPVSLCRWFARLLANEQRPDTPPTNGSDLPATACHRFFSPATLNRSGDCHAWWRGAQESGGEREKEREKERKKERKKEREREWVSEWVSKIETRGREDVSAYCAGTMILVARDTPGAEILEASRADSILRENRSEEYQKPAYWTRWNLFPSRTIRYSNRANWIPVFDSVSAENARYANNDRPDFSRSRIIVPRPSSTSLQFHRKKRRKKKKRISIIVTIKMKKVTDHNVFNLLMNTSGRGNIFVHGHCRRGKNLFRYNGCSFSRLLIIRPRIFVRLWEIRECKITRNPRSMKKCLFLRIFTVWNNIFLFWQGSSFLIVIT